MNSPHIYVGLSSAIGDAALSTAYLDGIREYANKYGISQRITLLTPPNIIPLIQPLARKYGYEIIPADRHLTIAKAKELISANAEQNAIVFEFDHSSGNPYVEVLPNSEGLILNDLLTSCVGLYDQSRSGNDRFSNYLGDLLSIPDNERIPVLPHLELPSNKDDIYNGLARKYNIDQSRRQIGFVVEGSYADKRLSLTNWKKIYDGLLRKNPNAEINIFFNGSPSGNYTLDELKRIFGDGSNVRFISEDLVSSMVLIGKQELVVANDTGLSHIAAIVEGGPKVVSMHLKYYPPQVWVSNSKRHTGILAPSDPEDNNMINRISIDDVLQYAQGFLDNRPISSTLSAIHTPPQPSAPGAGTQTMKKTVPLVPVLTPKPEKPVPTVPVLTSQVAATAPAQNPGENDHEEPYPGGPTPPPDAPGGGTVIVNNQSTPIYEDEEDTQDADSDEKNDLTGEASQEQNETDNDLQDAQPIEEDATQAPVMPIPTRQAIRN